VVPGLTENSMTQEVTEFTDEQRAAFAEAIEDTLVGGHLECEHLRAMRDCINVFATYRFNIKDSSISWLMLFIEAALMLSPDERAAYLVDMTEQLTKLEAALHELPQISHQPSEQEQDRSDLH
jgi:hypothetical protein